MASLRTLARYVLTFFLLMPLSHAATWTIIDYPGARVTEGVFGINSQGQMVGAYVDFASSEHGFLDDNGVFTTIDYPGVTHTQAVGINDSGQIVGTYYDVDGHTHGFFLDGQTFSTIEPPHTISSNLGKINNSGQMVGTYVDDQFVTSHGYIYDLYTGKFKTFNAPKSTSGFGNGINNLDDVVGQSSFNFGFWRSADGAYQILAYPGASYTAPIAVNDSRLIVGFELSQKGRSRAFVFSHGNYSSFNFPGGGGTVANGVNNGGAIVGTVSDPTRTPHGFLMTP